MIKKKNSHHSGNAIFFILIGVVMFAALIFTMTRGMNTSNKLTTEEEANLAATEVLSYGNTIRTVVEQLLLLKGASDINTGGNGILFSAPSASIDYGTFGDQPSTEIFNTLGGKVIYQIPAASICSISCKYEFTGQYTITGVGGDTKAELALVVAGMDSNVCKRTNSMLGHKWSYIPTGSELTLTRFDGLNYSDNGGANPITLTGGSNEFVAQRAFCYQESTGGRRNILVYVIKPR